MKIHFLYTVLFTLLLSNSGFSQEYLFQTVPFSSGTLDAIYTNAGKKVFCKIHFDNYGERYSADLKHSKEDADPFKSIIKKDGYVYYIMHKKNQVLKVPDKENVFLYDTSHFQRIEDTLFVNYPSVLYDGKERGVKLVYYNNMLLYLRDDKRDVEYKVLNVKENGDFPEYVFFLPRDSQVTEMNYNFSK